MKKTALFVLLLTISFVTININEVYAMPNLKIKNNVKQLKWENEFLGTDTSVKFYPDEYANYFKFSLNRDQDKNIGIKITGKLPDARYMSFNVYNDKKFSPVTSLTDYEIIPDKIAPTPNNNKSEDYTVYVLPNTCKENTSYNQLPNTLFYDNDIARLSVILRYYLPQEDNYGGVALPKIELFDVNTGKDVTVKNTVNFYKLITEKKHLNNLTNRIIKTVVSPLFLLNPEDDLYSYRFSGNGMFPNKDNQYLAMPVRSQKDKAVILRFKAPTLTQDENSDMRYYSISIGDETTQNHLTLNDKQLKVADDGYIYVLVSEKNYQLKGDIDYNYLSSCQLDKFVIIYRNLLTNEDFEGNLVNVPTVKTAKNKPAHSYIGDYAPVGKLLDIDDLLLTGFSSLKAK